MQWVRIIDCAADFSFAQKFVKGVAPFNANGVLVVDVFASFGHEGRHDAGELRKELVVFGSMRLAGALPTGKMAQLDAQDCGLNFIKAAVPAGFAAAIFFLLAVLAPSTQPGGPF